MAQERRWIAEAAAGDAKREQEMLARWESGEPLQYVLGEWSFRSLSLKVDSRVLIPRPETEVVAGLAINAVKQIVEPRVLDLGTGSGAIALAIADEVLDAFVVGVDVSTEALMVARANDSKGSVTWMHSDWFDDLPHHWRGTFDLVVSNPPYVADGDLLPTVISEWEPRRALYAGPAGTECLDLIVRGARAWLRSGATLVLELAPEQGDVIGDLARLTGYVNVSIADDLAGRSRALVANTS